ncbi:MAG: DUF1579 family protein [Planctomycetes bacterium]|nr:DUF1579 family protein [Planctomycetota bacterium]MCB9910283.1 DUF1579 family protein [Planctomycetota bacterium]HPF13437.1 DUF1579 family protein [Planctomycetota bacterium]HRV80776.1 DUF1579 family protein [Planctomycetota bacterium]
MKRLITCSIVALAGSLAVTTALSLAPQESTMPKPADQHKMLHKSIGTWEGTLTMFVPGQPETPMPAHEVVEAHGPFWTASHFACDMGGMQFEGFGSMGYDTTKEKFIGTWIDNMSTSLTLMEGDFDKETGLLTMRWEGPDMTGKMVPNRSEGTFHEDSYEMRFFMGDEPSMTISMKRKAPEKGAK